VAKRSSGPGGATRDGWSRQRRMIAKAEWTAGEANRRFVWRALSSPKCGWQTGSGLHFFHIGSVRFIGASFQMRT
jgi:hypothetical protein